MRIIKPLNIFSLYYKESNHSEKIEKKNIDIQIHTHTNTISMSNSQFYKSNAQRRVLMNMAPHFKLFLASPRPRNTCIGHPKILIDWYLTGNKFCFKKQPYMKDLKYIIKTFKNIKIRSNAQKITEDSLIEKIKLGRLNYGHDSIGMCWYKIDKEIVKIHKYIFKFKFHKFTHCLKLIKSRGSDDFIGMIKFYQKPNVYKKTIVMKYELNKHKLCNKYWKELQFPIGGGRIIKGSWQQVNCPFILPIGSNLTTSTQKLYTLLKLNNVKERSKMTREEMIITLMKM